MSNDKPRSGSKTQMGHAMPQRIRGFEDTLPSVSPEKLKPKVHESGDLLTSATVNSVVASHQASGSVTLSGARVSESLARELIVRKMAGKDINLLADYAYSLGDLLVRLDGFDPNRNIGYQFISHAGDDVVTDFDPEAENRLRELQAQGIVRVLIIHDYEAPDSDAVLARVDAFLTSL